MLGNWRVERGLKTMLSRPAERDVSNQFEGRVAIVGLRTLQALRGSEGDRLRSLTGT